VLFASAASRASDSSSQHHRKLPFALCDRIDPGLFGFLAPRRRECNRRLRRLLHVRRPAGEREIGAIIDRCRIAEEIKTVTPRVEQGR
jgi:hypothetical protein